MYTLYMYYIVLMNNYMYMCIIDSHVHTVHVLLMNNYMYMFNYQLDIMAPKQPEDIYKTHLEHARKYTHTVCHVLIM